jgi:hypothetical protein
MVGALQDRTVCEGQSQHFHGVLIATSMSKLVTCVVETLVTTSQSPCPHVLSSASWGKRGAGVMAGLQGGVFRSQLYGGAWEALGSSGSLWHRRQFTHRPEQVKVLTEQCVPSEMTGVGTEGQRGRLAGPEGGESQRVVIGLSWPLDDRAQQNQNKISTQRDLCESPPGGL